MTARELMAATGKTPAQIKAFLQAEKQAGNIESGRVIRARGGGVDTVYWVVETETPT